MMKPNFEITGIPTNPYAAVSNIGIFGLGEPIIVERSPGDEWKIFQSPAGIHLGSLVWRVLCDHARRNNGMIDTDRINKELNAARLSWTLAIQAEIARRLFWYSTKGI